MSDFTAAQKDKLLAELRMVVADAEELLKATAGDASSGVAELRGRVQARLQQAQANITQLQEVAVARVKEASQATDAYVHDNPWKAIGVAAGVGLLIGALIGRR
jgi:ElaB/YqjD/DUF883 family membrane-anchored ribosome-binding protein